MNLAVVAIDWLADLKFEGRYKRLSLGGKWFDGFSVSYLCGHGPV